MPNESTGTAVPSTPEAEPLHVSQVAEALQQGDTVEEPSAPVQSGPDEEQRLAETREALRITPGDPDEVTEPAIGVRSDVEADQASEGVPEAVSPAEAGAECALCDACRAARVERQAVHCEDCGQPVQPEHARVVHIVPDNELGPFAPARPVRGFFGRLGRMLWYGPLAGDCEVELYGEWSNSFQRLRLTQAIHQAVRRHLPDRRVAVRMQRELRGENEQFIRAMAWEDGDEVAILLSGHDSQGKPRTRDTVVAAMLDNIRSRMTPAEKTIVVVSERARAQAAQLPQEPPRS